MHKPANQETNRRNLIDVFGHLRGIECFPFFGTLLGLTRNGDVIPHDDDVDVYVNINDRDRLLKLLAESEFRIDLQHEHNSTKWFLQAVREDSDAPSYVDFYFYEDDIEVGCVVERWNFSGDWEDGENHLHVPRNLIYPISEAEFFSVRIPMPANPAGCCQYLYGGEWRRPLMKRLGYSTEIVNNVPQIEVKPDQFAEVIRQFYILDEALLIAQKDLADAQEQLANLRSTFWWRSREWVQNCISSLWPAGRN